jgi:hypothetical protein
MMIVPSENVGIVVLSNYGSNRVSLLPEGLVQKFMDLYLGLPEVDWNARIMQDFTHIKTMNKRHKAMERAQNPAPAMDLKQYVGVYKNDVYGTVTISENENKLVMHYKDKIIDMEHFNGNQFTFPGHMLSVAFSEGDVGYMYFGSRTKGKIDLMQIPTLLREGAAEGLFERK